MSARPPIIALAPNEWSGRRLNRQHILSRLAARGWPVVYSTGALSVWDRGGSRWAEAGWLGSFEQIEGVQVDRPGRLPPRWQRHPGWDRFVVRNHARRLVRSAGPSAPGAICYVFHPEYWPYIEYIRPRYVVYHAFDAYDVMPDWSPQLGDWRNQMLRRADLKVVTFEGITRFYPEELRETTRELPNGVDEKFLAGEAACPPDLTRIPRPRIGCIGAVNPKVDFGLLIEVAASRPDWHWVVMGKSDLETEAAAGPHIDSMRAWKAFRALPNVHYLGVRPFAEIPAYASHMDVNTICYRTGADGWWSFGSPNKLHEQLAAGRPVIASPLETIRPFANVVALAETPAEWLGAIDRALVSGGVGTPDERRAIARQNTWDQRVDVLEGWLSEMLGRPCPTRGSHAGEGARTTEAGAGRACPAPTKPAGNCR